MDSVSSLPDVFWITFVVAGVTAEVLDRTRLWRSRRAMHAELRLLLDPPAGCAAVESM